MSRRKKLQDKHAEICRRLEALNLKEVRNTDGLSEDEQTEYATLRTELEAVAIDCRAAEDEMAAEKLLIGGPNDPIHRDSTPNVPAAKRGKKYVELFGNHTSADGWESSEQFLGTVARNQFDPRLRNMANMGEGLGSTGGFAVPTEFASEWLNTALEEEIVRPRATVYPMASDTKKVPGWDMSSNSSTTFGGFTTQWLTEGATAADSDPALRQIKLTAKKLALFTKVSSELASDGVSFTEQLGGAMSSAVAFSLDYAFFQGAGGGQPLGIINSDSIVTVAKESGQVADTIIYENLAKMFARLHPSCRANSLWIANSTCIPQLLQLSVVIGVGGTHVPVMTQADGKFYILTREVLFTEKLPAVGTKGDILFCDLSKYVIGMRKEVSIDSSMHIGWQTDEVGFRGILRADGMPAWDKPVTPKAGDTLSWCVALADR